MIKEKLQTIFQSVFGRSDVNITDDLTAHDIDEWDSITHIQMIVAVEKAFAIKFKNAEIARLQNVGDLICLIEKYC